MENLLRHIIILSIICSWSYSISQETNKYITIRKTNISNVGLDLKMIKLNEIEIEIEKIITYYENNGYPFANVKLENIDINENEADIIVNTGNRYTIDSLIIHGLKNISEKKLYKIIQMKKGDIYNQSKINNINNLINKSNYVSQKKENEFVFYKNTFDMYFYLEKINNNQIEGLIG